MEGVLWVRVRRGKLLRGWQKRYFVLSDDGALKEFAESSALSDAPPPPPPPAATAGKRRYAMPDDERALADKSGMVLVQELLVLGATTVKTLPFPMIGRNHVFQMTKKGEFRLSLGAKSADGMQQWLRALRAVIATSGGGRRERSPAISGRALPPTPWIHSPSLEQIATRGSDDDFLDVPVLSTSDLARFADSYEWCHERVRTTQTLMLGGENVPRGSVLVAANGIALQTLSTEQVTQLLRTPRRTLGLRFLRAPRKRGVLRCQACAGLSTQLRMLSAQCSGVREWEQQVVELDGDVLTCAPRAAARGNMPRRVLPLTAGCTVKTVHELVADRRCCFMVSVQAHSMLFQARSDADVAQWTDAIQCAIQLAEGAVPGPERASFDSLQLQSSLNMRSLQSGLAFADDDDDGGGDSGSDRDEGDELRHPQLRRVSAERPLPALPALLPSDDECTSERAAPHLPANDVSDMLVFLQRGGRHVEALQLLGRNTSHRRAYWRKIFRWALEPVERDTFETLLQRPLVDADLVQVQKDIPRTSKWLAGSAGAPVLSADASRVRLERLGHVLHAFLSSCTSHVRTDDESDDESDSADAATEASSRGKSFYMQGMNGLAFILLDVLDEDELTAFQFFRGAIARVLPHVFGIRSERGSGERDNFDLFSSLAEVGAILEEVVALHLPHFHGAMEAAGIPVCLLAYKWFPTLFSDISLMAHNAQLRYDTLLVAWDICLLMGLEGIFCVALALFSSAEERVVAAGRDASAEQISNALVRVLSQLPPEDLVTAVCEVLELCSHHVLLKLRNGHRRRLQLGYAKQQYDGVHSGSNSNNQGVAAASRSNSSSSHSRDGASLATAAASSTSSSAARSAPLMTVTDLDSGKVFNISRSGNMLLPVMRAVGS